MPLVVRKKKNKQTQTQESPEPAKKPDVVSTFYGLTRVESPKLVIDLGGPRLFQ